MAIAQPSSLVYAIRGKVGSEVYSVWQGQQIVKAYNAAPFLDPPSDKMLLIQALVAEANTCWQGLVPPEKIAWDNVAKLQKQLPIKSNPRGGVLSIVPPNKSTAFGRDIFIGCYINAWLNGLNDPDTWDLLLQYWDALTGWTEVGNGTSEIDPVGQLHLLPDVNDVIGRWRDIGELPDTPFTAQFEIYFDSLGTIASGNVFRIDFFNGIHRYTLRQGTDKLQYFAADSSFKDFALTAETGVRYIYRFIFYSGDPFIKVYRRTPATTWTYYGEITDINVNAANDGRVEVNQYRGAAGDSECHIEFIYIATGSFVPGECPAIPLGYQKPQPPTALSGAYAGGKLTASWTAPSGFANAKHRIGVWAQGTKSLQGKIYRQRLGRQVDPTTHSLDWLTIYAAVTGNQVISTIVPFTLWLQAYTCDKRTGVMSAGSNTTVISLT